MKIHTYHSDSGRDKIMEYIESLSGVEQIDAFSVLECMEKQKNRTEQKDKKQVLKRAKELGAKLGKVFV